MEFSEWLIKEKNYGRKSAYDVCSRLYRATRILGTDDIPLDAETIIEKKEEFKKLSVCVRSQLRIALRRYNEYITSKTN